jgi:hypothetical protein
MAALSPQAVVTIMADRLRDLAKMRGWEDWFRNLMYMYIDGKVYNIS